VEGLRFVKNRGLSIYIISHVQQPQPAAPPEQEEANGGGKQGGGRKRPRQPTKPDEEKQQGPGREKTWGLAGLLRQFAARVAEFQPFWEVRVVLVFISGVIYT
jgi:hypothetical protein